MAYRSLTLALEGPLRRRPVERFAEAALHVINGHLSPARHHAAGRALEGSGIGEDELERRGAEILACDFNPFILGMAWSGSRRGALLIHQTQNHSWIREVRTFVEPSGESGFQATSRVLAEATEDPTYCRDMHFAGMDLILAGLPISSGKARPTRTAAGSRSTLSELARLLSVSASAAADCVDVFEAEPETRASALAAKLGCGARSLQRQLKAEGVSAVVLRQSCMLVRATGLLRTEASATAAAHAAGYSDLAHMSRAFVASCGVPPSVIWAAMRPS